MSNDKQEAEMVSSLQVGGLYQLTKTDGLYMTKWVDQVDFEYQEDVFGHLGDIVMVTKFVSRQTLNWDLGENKSPPIEIEWYHGLFISRSGNSDAGIHYVLFQFDRYSHLASVTRENLIPLSES